MSLNLIAKSLLQPATACRTNGIAVVTSAVITSSQSNRNNHIRHTSTTANSGGGGVLTSDHATPVVVAKNCKRSSVMKRDASTQAQHQQQVLEAAEQQQVVSRRSIKLAPLYGNVEDDVNAPFTSDELVVMQCPENELKPKPSVDQLMFGHIFTDHMFQVEYNEDSGWSVPLISKVRNLDLHPAAKVLHYAIEAFEGAKAFRGHDNKIRFFRLDENVNRLLRSTRRLALPEFDPVELIKCIHKLVHLEQNWIPKAFGKEQLTSLYIRPTIMGIEPTLGVARSRKALLYVLLSPVGPYFKTGFKPISLYADPSFVRAWPGGAGNAKLGSNYAPTLMIQREAEKLGLQQVLWLYDHDMKLTEVGTMNIFVSIQNKSTGKVHLITPPLSDGLVLPGITRASILELARQWNDVVCEERYVTINELKQLIQEKRLIEMFGAGTACVVCPINGIQMKDGTKIEIPFIDVTKKDSANVGGNNLDTLPEASPFLTKRILQAITDIQYGRTPHQWAEQLINS